MNVRGTMTQMTGIDGSLYPDRDVPSDFHTEEEKADYVARVCGAWDFGITPEVETLRLVTSWATVLQRFPLEASPAYHAFRTLAGLAPIPIPELATPARFEVLDRRAGREPDRTSA